jgi:hypothetical protein
MAFNKKANIAFLWLDFHSLNMEYALNKQKK